MSSGYSFQAKWLSGNTQLALTVDRALYEGVTAHKEGKLQEAERLYLAILQAQPKHPDANHNFEYWLWRLISLLKLPPCSNWR